MNKHTFLTLSLLATSVSFQLHAEVKGNANILPIEPVKQTQTELAQTEQAQVEQSVSTLSDVKLLGTAGPQLTTTDAAVNSTQNKAGNNNMAGKDKAVDAMLSQVLNSLPKDKRESLEAYKPNVDITAGQNLDSASSTVDSYGRTVTNLVKSTASYATGAPVESEDANISPFERKQREMAKKYKLVQTYKLRPSDNITIPAAKYILNSIRMSFDEIEMRSSDPNVVVKVEDNFVYFSTNNDAPFNLILFEKGVPETQVNLTIWPLQVMPAMIQVNVNYDTKLKAKVANVIEKRKQDQVQQEERIRNMESEIAVASDPKLTTAPYLDRMYNTISMAAGGQNPKGFDLQTNIPVDAKYPCSFNTKAETKQRLISSRQILDVVLVENTLNHNVVLREQDCWKDADVVATGILNKATLHPGEKTEVYVMRDRLYSQRKDTKNERPSLLD